MQINIHCDPNHTKKDKMAFYQLSILTEREREREGLTLDFVERLMRDQTPGTERTKRPSEV